MTLAPARAYLRACSGAQMCSAISPLDGEARLTSAINDNLNGELRNLPGKEICGGDIFKSYDA